MIFPTCSTPVLMLRGGVKLRCPLVIPIDGLRFQLLLTTQRGCFVALISSADGNRRLVGGGDSPRVDRIGWASISRGMNQGSTSSNIGSFRNVLCPVCPCALAISPCPGLPGLPGSELPSSTFPWIHGSETQLVRNPDTIWGSSQKSSWCRSEAAMFDLFLDRVSSLFDHFLSPFYLLSSRYHTHLVLALISDGEGLWALLTMACIERRMDTT